MFCDIRNYKVAYAKLYKHTCKHLEKHKHVIRGYPLGRGSDAGGRWNPDQNPVGKNIILCFTSICSTANIRLGLVWLLNLLLHHTFYTFAKTSTNHYRGGWAMINCCWLRQTDEGGEWPIWSTKSQFNLLFHPVWIIIQYFAITKAFIIERHKNALT